MVMPIYTGIENAVFLTCIGDYYINIGQFLLENTLHNVFVVLVLIAFVVFRVLVHYTQFKEIQDHFVIGYSSS